MGLLKIQENHIDEKPYNSYPGIDVYQKIKKQLMKLMARAR